MRVIENDQKQIYMQESILGKICFIHIISTKQKILDSHRSYFKQK